MAVFEDRTIRHTAVIPVAGNQVTNDIRKGLGVLTEQAEKLKCSYGFALVASVVDDGPIMIPGIGGRPPLDIDKRLLAQIIQPRMEEIFEIAALEIKRSGYSRHLSAGVVMTGGGALIKGVSELAQEILGMPVKIGIPAGPYAGLVREIENPIYSTCVGLVLHGLHHRDSTPFQIAESRQSSSVKKIFGRMKSWFDEL
jgi:cell division protein FtsA